MRLPRLALAAACLGLAVLAIAGYLGEKREGAPVHAFVDRFTIALRRPADAETVPFAPAGDLAAGVIANAALQDAVEPISLSGMDPALRQAWIDSRENLGDELESARQLMLRAVERRPGWAYHPFVLATLTYAAEQRGRAPNDLSAAGRWEAPLEMAAAEAPGDDAIFTFWAGTYLSSGSAEARRRLPAILPRAFRDPLFVSAELAAAQTVLGRRAALALVPLETAPLKAAEAVLLRAGDLELAAAVRTRLENAERQARADGLRRLEARAEIEDPAALEGECAAFASAHPAAEIDDGKGRSEAARLLALWPGERRGEWRNDPRAELIRFFLDGRRESVPGPVLANAAAALAGVPDAVLARLLLGAGDVSGARSLARSSPSLGGFEWTPFLVELADHELNGKRIPAAREALDELAPAARGECNVLLVRRRIARASGDQHEAARITEELGVLLPSAYPSEEWSGSGSRSLCIDPEAAGSRSLAVAIAAKQQALVEYGWDGGRSGSLLVSPPGARVSLPLCRIEGRHIATVRAVAGGPITLSATLGAR